MLLIAGFVRFDPNQRVDRFRSRVGGLGVREFTLQKYLIDPSAPTGRA